MVRKKKGGKESKNKENEESKKGSEMWAKVIRKNEKNGSCEKKYK